MTAEERTLEMMATTMDAVCGPKKAAMMLESTRAARRVCNRHGRGTTITYESAECPWCAREAGIESLHKAWRKQVDELLVLVKRYRYDGP